MKFMTKFGTAFRYSGRATSGINVADDMTLSEQISRIEDGWAAHDQVPLYPVSSDLLQDMMQL